MAVVRPVEVVADDDRARDVPRRVAVVAHRGVAAADMAEDGVVIVELTGDRPGVGVGQQLGRVEPVAPRRLPRAVHPEAVLGARTQPRQIAVPDVEGLLVQRVTGLGAVLVEDAQLDVVGAFGPQGDVRAFLVGGDPEGCPVPRPQSLDRHLSGSPRSAACRPA